MIPVYLKTRGLPEPAASVYYLVASNGIFLVKKSALFASVTQARMIHGLEPQSETLTLALPKVPRDVLEPVYGFFLEAYRRWESEAVAFLFFSPDTGSFQVAVPPQTIVRRRSFGAWRTDQRVDYGHAARPKGYLKLGDIHSHADVPAFFSHIDDEDDREDGLRIVMGRLNRPRPDVRVSFVSGRTRFFLDPEEVLEEFGEPAAPSEDWLKQITCRNFGEEQHEPGEPRCWN